MVKNKKEFSNSEGIVKRLDAILNVLLSTPTSEGKSFSMLRRVELLSASGLRNVEIAEILGATQVSVGVMINKLKKKKLKKKPAKR